MLTGSELAIIDWGCSSIGIQFNLHALYTVRTSTIYFLDASVSSGPVYADMPRLIKVFILSQRLITYS